MTVKELIAELQLLPQDNMVVLQKDSEGNGYSPLVGAATALYLAENTWSGEVRNEDEVSGEEADEFEKVVVLWPIC